MSNPGVNDIEWPFRKDDPQVEILPSMTAKEGSALPIAYGRVRLVPQIIEKYAPAMGGYPAWVGSTSYISGDRVESMGNLYQCSVAGVSASDPTGYGRVGPAGTGVRTENYTIPSSGPYTVSVAGASLFKADQGVVDVTTQKPMHVVSAYPGTGQYTYSSGVYTFAAADAGHIVQVTYKAGITDNTCAWDYVQGAQGAWTWYQTFVAALCEGEIAGSGSYLWWDKTQVQNRGGLSLWLPAKLGVRNGPDALNQTLPTNPTGFGDAGNAYQHTALLYAATDMCMSGTKQEIPDMALEVIAKTFASETDGNVSPADVIYDLLTHNRRGCGWPSTRVDTSVTASGASSYRAYCDAAGFRFGLAIQSQRTALDILADILTATHSTAVWSSGKLKVLPLGDQAIAMPAYGSVSYVPSNGAVADLGVDDFLDEGEPVQVVRSSEADVYSEVPVEYVDRSLGYVQRTVSDPEMAHIDVYGRRVASTLSLPVVFTDGTPAIKLSRIYAQRSTRIRNTYTFRVPWRFVWLEAGDVVTLTEPALGLNLTPVRITQFSEGDDGITLTAEDYPAGASSAGAYLPQVGDGYTPQESGSVSTMPTAVGVQIGVEEGVIGVNALNGATDSAQNLVPNPNFLIWTPPRTIDDSPPDRWTPAKYFTTSGGYPTGTFPVADPALWGGVITIDMGQAYTGAYSVKIDLGSNYGAGQIAHVGLLSGLFPVTGGEPYGVTDFYALDSSGANDKAIASVIWYDVNKQPIGTFTGSLSAFGRSVWGQGAGSAYTHGPGRAPSNARYAAVFLHAKQAAGGAALTVYMDGIVLKHMPTVIHMYNNNSLLSVNASTWTECPTSALGIAWGRDDYGTRVRVANNDHQQYFAIEGSINFNRPGYVVPVNTRVQAALYKVAAHGTGATTLLTTGPYVIADGANEVPAAVALSSVQLNYDDVVYLACWHNASTAQWMQTCSLKVSRISA